MTARRIYVRKQRGLWRWECWLCQPPALGATTGFVTTLRSVFRHCEHRRAHHAWVARHRPAL